MLGWLIRRVSDWMIGFIAQYHSHSSGLQVIQSYRYSTHFRFTVPHALGFSVFTSRILATDLSSLSLQITYEVFFAQSNSFLAISSHTLRTSISSTRPNSLPTTVMYFLLLFFFFCCTSFCSVSTTTVLLKTSYDQFAGLHGKHRLLLSRTRVYWSVT
jgi:hypothetical protein